jgi:hypothetical protein
MWGFLREMAVNARLMPKPDEVGEGEPARPILRLNDLVYDPSEAESLSGSPRFIDRNLLWTDPVEDPISFVKGPWAPGRAAQHLPAALLLIGGSPRVAQANAKADGRYQLAPRESKGVVGRATGTLRTIGDGLGRLLRT